MHKKYSSTAFFLIQHPSLSPPPEPILRIDENVLGAQLDVEAAHSEILKYFQSVTSNRWLMVKIFLILIVFFIIFVVFLAWTLSTLRHSVGVWNPYGRAGGQSCHWACAGCLGEGPRFLGTAKNDHCPRSPTPCLWPPSPPLTTLQPMKHTRFWIWTLLWSGWKGAEANWGARRGDCLYQEIFINPPQPVAKGTLAARGDDAFPHVLESKERKWNCPRDQLSHLG